MNMMTPGVCFKTNRSCFDQGLETALNNFLFRDFLAPGAFLFTRMQASSAYVPPPQILGAIFLWASEVGQNICASLPIWSDLHLHY